MQLIISKSQFKPKALEYLRLVEQNKSPLIITHAGKPVIKMIPYTKNISKLLEPFRGSVKSFSHPDVPVGLSDWETLK